MSKRARQPVVYGCSVMLFCDDKDGYITTTDSALSPIGVQGEDPTTEHRKYGGTMEPGVFVVLPADGDTEANGEPLKFGHVVQLLHSSRRQNVAWRRENAMVDKSCLKVGFGSGDKSAMWDQSRRRWRVLPRYKSRSEGERVLGDDAVILQAASGDRLYLRASDAKNFEPWYEVNCGAAATSFSLRLFDPSTKVNRDRSLRRGDFVSFFHRESDCYLIADPNGRVAFEPSAGDLSTASRRLFVLEGVDSHTGGVLGVDDELRLKAVGSTKYVTLGPTVTLTSELPGTVVTLVRADDGEGETLATGNQVFLCTTTTADVPTRWLGIGDAERSTNVTTALLKRASRFQAKALSAQSKKDALEVFRVDDSAGTDMQVISALCQPFRPFYDRMMDGRLRLFDFLKCSANLEELIHRLVGKDGGPTAEVQTLFAKHEVGRNCLKLLLSSVADGIQRDALNSAKVLQTSEQDEGALIHYSDVLNIVNLAIRLVKLQVVGQPKIAASLLNEVSCLVSLAEYVPLAVDCLICVYHHNPALIDPRADLKLPGVVAGFCRQYESKMETDILLLLANICRCNDEPVREGQDAVVEGLLKKNPTSRLITLMKAEASDDILATFPDRRQVYIDSLSHEDAQFLCKQFVLFAAVSFGRTTSTGYVLSAVSSLDLVLEIAEDNKCLMAVRGAAMRLAASLLAVKPDLRDQLACVRCVMEGNQAHNVEFCAAANPSQVRAKVLTAQLLRNADIADDNEQLRFMDSYVRLAQTLLHSGVIILAEIVEFAEALFTIARERSKGKPETARRRSRVVIRALDMLLLCTDFVVAHQLTDLVTFFRHHHNEVLANEVPIDDVPGTTDQLVFKPPVHVWQCGVSSTIECINNTNDDELLGKALDLFFRVTNAPEILHISAQSLQLLSSDQSRKIFDKARSASGYFKQLSQTSVMTGPQIGRAENRIVELEGTLTSSQERESKLENLNMLRQADVPQQIILFLASLREPLKSNDARRCCVSAVRLLKHMSEDPKTRRQLRSQIRTVAHLIQLGVDWIGLVLELFDNSHAALLSFPREVADGLVTCLSNGDIAVEAVNALCKLLSHKDPQNRYYTENQRLIWTCLNENASASKLMWFHDRWSGRGAADNRKAAIAAGDNTLRLHVGLAELVFRIAIYNNLVDKAEIREKVFGSDAVTDLLEVSSDATLPHFFRQRYVSLLRALVCKDKKYEQHLIKHSAGPRVLEVFQKDAQLLLYLIGGKVPNDEAYLLQPPEVGVDLLLNLVIDSELRVATRMVLGAKEEMHLIGVEVLENLANAVNALVDVVCDVARHLFVIDPDCHARQVLTPALAKQLRTFLVHVPQCGTRSVQFRGTESWSDEIERFESIISTPGTIFEDAGPQPPPTAETSTSLTDRWLRFVDSKVGKSMILHRDNALITAAGTLCRSTENIHKFFSQLFHVVAVEGSSNTALLHFSACLARQTLRYVKTEGQGLKYDTSRQVFPDPPKLTKTRFHEILVSAEVLSSLCQHLPSPATCNEVMASVIELLDDPTRPMQAATVKSLAHNTRMFSWLRQKFLSCQERLRLFKYSNDGVNLQQTINAHLLKGLDLIVQYARFVQVLCEGHFEEMQDLVRQQPRSAVSINLLECLVDVLRVAVCVVRQETTPLILQMLSTLTEATQGASAANQSFLVTCGAGKCVSQALAISSGAELDQDARLSIQRNTLTFLLSMIEGRSDYQHFAKLIHSMTLEKVIDAINDSTQRYLQREVKHTNNCLHNELTIAVNAFIFCRACYDVEAQALQLGKEHLKQLRDGHGRTFHEALARAKHLDLVTPCISSIEIVNNSRELQRVYFHILDGSRKSLMKEIRKEIIHAVDRSSDTGRIRDFFSCALMTAKALDFYAKLRRSLVLSSLFRHASKLDYICLLLSFAINGIQLVVVTAPLTVTDDSITRYVPAPFGIITLILAYCLLAVEFLVFVVECINAVVYVWQRCMDWDFAQRRAAQLANRSELGAVKEQLFSERARRWQIVVLLKFLFEYGRFWQQCVYVTVTLLGIFVHYAWFSLLLLQLTVKSALLYNVFKAVWTGGASLMLTWLMMMCVVFIFSSFGFYYYNETFDPLGDAANYMHCQTMWNCFLVHLDGLRNDGVIPAIPLHVDMLRRTGYELLAYYWLYWMFLAVICLNVLFGIIVDSFAQLREERASIARDQNSKCFICGIEQNRFDRHGGFDNHTLHEHNMWSYIFFFQYLWHKDYHELNGPEQYVFGKIDSRDCDFFPIGRALMLESGERNET